MYEDAQSPFVAWFRELLRGPVSLRGRYFETLAQKIESSAPLCVGDCA